MGCLHNKIAVVTGSARGIGRAIAEELGSHGATVVVNYSHSKEAAEELVEVLLRNGAPHAPAIRADVSDPAQAAELIARTIDTFGRLDILVNNAGITADHAMKNLSIDEWDHVIQVDLSSCFYTVKAALPYFTRQESGQIVNISSFVGEAGNFGQANYAAAKAGIVGFTKTAALELARYNVTVNAVCPGFIETAMYATVPENLKEVILKRIPLGRAGKPQDVARAVRFLVVDGEYITGQTINVNGGIYM
ncbi:MAG TPA: 3-oxoacyl-ACP reductase family protein [Chloroflexota bacterium]|nr:3-oxoacyl-ACP reductase family protein [Chloroflexota bacterium]